MNCEQAEKMIARSVDGELAVKEVGALRRHLAECEGCAALASEARDLKAWFVTDTPVEVPSGFAQRVATKAFAQAGEREVRAGFSPQVLTPEFSSPQGGVVQGSFGAGPKDRFLMGLTALAAALLLALGMALYVQRANQSYELDADDESLQEAIDGLNDVQNAPNGQAPKPAEGVDGE